MLNCCKRSLPPLFPGSEAILADISAGETPALPGRSERLQIVGLYAITHRRPEDMVEASPRPNVFKSRQAPAFPLNLSGRSAGECRKLLSSNFL